MPSVMQPAEFFVVGGPVQPERPCYVERAADRKLFEAVRAKRLCCVLGSPAIGKTSLLLRAARALRAAGSLVTLLDLRLIAEHGGGGADDDGLRLIAARLAADLALDVDVASWWSARDRSGENRLAAFFWEVVLTNTTAQIVLLVDDVDALLEAPFAAAFLDAVGACYERRGREPDFARLNVVLAGCASRRALASLCPGSPLAAAELIEPGDFSAREAYRLAVAFGGEQELAQALMDRICAWTGGQPYLTQRVARGVARKGGGLENVERVVREQLLAPGAADQDPLLALVRASLGEPSRVARRATRLLQKLAAGRRVMQPADVEVWERLWLSGTVAVDPQRKLGVRNRIVKELVAARWLREKASPWRWLAAAVVLLAVLGAGAYWYTQRLPVADIETLTSATAAPAQAEAAYRRLRGLPGFALRADELWLDALARHSRAALTLQEAAAADARLRALPGQDPAADRLLSEFWLRRARAQAHAEQRDAAILLAQRAAALPAADPAAASYLAELVGEDYAALQRSMRLASAPGYWHMTFAQASLVSIDAEQRALRTPFGAAPGAAALDTAPLELSALEHAALTRELTMEGEGTAGEFELSLTVQHAVAEELLVTLTAPSGAEAAVALPRSDGALVETFTFQAAQGATLAQLADEGASGVWRLTVVDRTAGNTGVFGGWGLRFGDTVRRDDSPELVPIPDPRRSAAVDVQAVGDRAVAWPVASGAVGTVALWNLATGQLEHDFTLPSAPRRVALDPTSTRVLAATERVAMLWNAADGTLIARIATQTEFVLPPVFSADGGYVAIAERVDGSSPLYSVLRSADASLVASMEGTPDATSWELGPGGRYVALQGPATVVRVLETRRGTELSRLAHAEAVERLFHSADGAALVTVDRAGTITAWPLAGADAGRGRPLGSTAATTSVSISADGRRLAFTRDDGAVAVLDVAARAELYRLRLPRTAPVTRTQLSADGVELATQSGARLRLWNLPGANAAARTDAADSMPSALAVDRTTDLLAIGLSSGQLRLAPLSALGAPASPLAYFGHRGHVTATALNGTAGLAASGGRDGIVRLWDIASGTPTGAVMQPAESPIALVALSRDGRYVANATGRVARVAAVADGRVAFEWRAEGTVSALTFAPDGTTVAVGDTAGGVALVPLGAARERANVRLEAAATALAFTPEGSRLAVGDANGGITLINAATATTEARIARWSEPLRWLDFSPDGSALLAATDAWAHSLDAATPALAPQHSKLVVWPAASTALTAISPAAVGLAGVTTDGSLVARVVDLAAAGEPAGDAAALVARDWSAAFALRLNDNGEPVPLDP